MQLPDAGHIAWVELDDARGTEQAGRRPALVLSSRDYHDVSRRVIICPITSRFRGWPSDVRLPASLQTKGAVLCDQIRTIDREHRAFDMVETVPESVLIEVRYRLASLLGIEIGASSASVG